MPKRSAFCSERAKKIRAAELFRRARLQRSKKMKVIFAGDISTHHAREIKGAAAEAALAELRPILDGADYRLVNQENVLCKEGVGYAIAKSGPNLRGDEESIDLLKAGSINCVVECTPHLGNIVMEMAIKLKNGENIDKVTHPEETVFTEFDDLSSIAARGY